MKKRATALEVAKAAGVSKWTVIRAFTPGASIAESSRQKVLAVAETMSYRPNLLARSLATSSTQHVAVFVDDFTNPHKLEMLETLTAALQAEELVAVIVNINEHFDHVHALLNADQRQVDAIVLLGTSFRDETLSDVRLGESAPPLFVLARDSQTSRISPISCDSGHALAEICTHLWARGYRRPAFMTGPRTLSTALGRRQHFEAFWMERGIEAVPTLSAERYSHRAGGDAARAFLQASPSGLKIDLLMCENDILACGAMDVLRSEFALRVPEDLAIVGFDDTAIAGFPTYDLTTYRQPIAAMVDALVDMLAGRRASEPVSLPGELVLRSSA
ncbi:LacI family DNA-binding transcriptional regulator [Aureimonas psammosilenae]|uniref:LacI family DNA-binding transcriptional regulator n=1 Tax=Aureimonas psammosilenae TaxID=2495496 RepID=UPI00126112A3|nr:LacI family DNA-binding transcriptional regulator [Aureimonas psammosilenae]